ncbi:ATM interactor [Ooceraea biroi]|uniref:ATM interactor n=1 Tax=Ooceraea biroi TaxID=2015173 RepID=A0A026WND0_OOCBI|nr:ATM interactor [Ooceraea biroi]
MSRRLPAESGVPVCEKIICPPPEELSVIVNNVTCQCGLVFKNESRYRLHDLKVHQKKKLDKITKENVRYHCPVQSCVYAVNSQKCFSSLKYLKQHYLKVHAERKYACDRCSKSFSTESAKDGHVRVCGIEFTCTCSKTYTTYEALLTHAKRLQHVITEKENFLNTTSLRCANFKSVRVVFPTEIVNKPVTILPKPDKSSKNISITTRSTSDAGTQTDDYKGSKRVSSRSKFTSNNQHYAKRRKRVSKQMQTSKGSGKSTQTQTQAVRSASEARRRGGGRRASSKQSEHALIKEELNLGDNFASANLFPSSPLPLRHDVGLQDFWEEKNTSGTQTLPEKDIFKEFIDNVTQTEFEALSTHEHSYNPPIQCVPVSTVVLMTLPYVVVTPPVATEGYSSAPADGVYQVNPTLSHAAKTFDDGFSSIETQTEQAFSPSLYSESLPGSFALGSNMETQSTNNLDNMAQLLYNNMCTQTCDEMLSSDLGLSNIQTQTAWTHDDTTVSTETQTKSLICQSDCNIPIGGCRSWLNTQTSHTETQTDLLSIVEGLE